MDIRASLVCNFIGFSYRHELINPKDDRNAAVCDLNDYEILQPVLITKLRKFLRELVRHDDYLFFSYRTFPTSFSFNYAH